MRNRDEFGESWMRLANHRGAAGLSKSPDGGRTLEAEALRQPGGFSAAVIDRMNSQVIYADADSGHWFMTKRRVGSPSVGLSRE